MYIDQTHGLNKKPLEYLMRGMKKKNNPIIAKWNSVPDPYMGQGSHPDVVERVWDVIGESLPRDCRCLIYGTPALVHPESGILLAFCNGTTYCIRLNEELFDEALKAGAKTYQKWSYGGDMDTLRELETYWIFGLWSKRETEWCHVIYEKLGDM